MYYGIPEHVVVT